MPRKQHLREAHGLSKVPDLRKAVGLASVPQRAKAAEDSFTKRWNLTFAEFSRVKWPGAHDIFQDPSVWRSYDTQGRKWSRPFHKCKACGIEVSRDSIPTATCSSSKGPIPDVAERKQLWAQCRQAASTQLGCKRTLKKLGIIKTRAENAKGQATSSGLRAAATKATGRGLRGKRIGEARATAYQGLVTKRELVAASWE